jgi:hypothetical protein
MQPMLHWRYRWRVADAAMLDGTNDFASSAAVGDARYQHDANTGGAAWPEYQQHLALRPGARSIRLNPMPHKHVKQIVRRSKRSTSRIAPIIAIFIITCTSDFIGFLKILRPVGAARSENKAAHTTTSEPLVRQAVGSFPRAGWWTLDPLSFRLIIKFAPLH